MLRRRPATQCPVSGVGVFAGSVYALLHIVQLLELMYLQAPSPPCYTVSSRWRWCVCWLSIRHVTHRPVSGVGVFAGSVYALLHRVQSVALVCLLAQYTPCYTSSSQWCWCVCRLRLRPATHCPVSGVGVFAGSVCALLHSVQSVMLVCLQAPSTPCYTVSSLWCWCVCRLHLCSATPCPVSGVGVFAGSVCVLLLSVQSVLLVCLLAPSTLCYTSSS